MPVSELIEDLKAKTLIYIENENWERVNQIYQICPRQILFFKKKVEKKIQEFLDKSQNPFEQKKYDHETKGNFFQFRKPFKLVFIILRENRKFINKDLRKNICSNILNAIPIQLKKGTIFGLQDYFNAFYPELIEFHYDDLVNFPRILDYILKIDSNLIVDLFPEIIDKGYYEFGHTLIIEHPEIISNKEDDVKSLLMNLVVYEEQYEVLVDHLNTYNPKLIQILEESRVKLKNEYFDKLMHSQKGHIDDSLFKYENKVFRHTFDLFSDDELIKIINKFIDLEIMVSHYGESEREQRWTNILLLHISWNGKSYLFKDFIKDLVKLGYLQLVEGYFSQHPNEIKVNQKLILEKMDSFGLDLLSKKYESFDINDPVKLFKKLIYETLHYDNIIIRTFFSRNTDLIKEFKEILINYVEDYDFSYTENLQAVYYKIEHLLRYIYSDYPKYTPKLKIFHIEKFLERISSEPEIAEVFRFSYNRIIPNNFNLIRKSLQVEILDYLIKNKLLSTIEFYLKINIKNFEAHIPRILKFEPEHNLQSEHFIKVLEFILKNEFIHQEIRNLTIHRLKSQVNCSRKVELYSFLGDLNMAFQVIQKLLKTEEVLPYMINLYIDHQLIEIELSIEKSKNLPLNELIKEIAKLEVLFNKFNTSQSLKPNFLFKLASYKARLFLYKGFEYLNDYDYSISAKNFKESSELYYRLMNSPKIRNDTKSMFKTYWIIADFFSRRINSIKIFRGNDITKLNSFIEEHLLELTHELLKSNLQHQRIADMIKKIQFDPDNSLINQLKCEIPTKFCSIRPVVLFKRLFDDGNEILFEWDKDDESKLIDVIIMLQGWRRFYLEVEFTENQRYYDFELEAKEKGFFEIKDIEKKPPQSGKVIFEFRLKLEEFIGEDTLEFKLTESDICAYEVDVNIPIVFENVTRNFYTQDTKKVLKNQPTLAELDIIPRIQNLSNKLNEKIEKWLNNFEEEEKEFSIKLLENFRYIDIDELNEICGKLYTKLLEQVEKKLKDIQFIAFDELSKSSHMIAYHFALAQGLPQEKFINVYNKDFNFPTNKVIVYIDDVIGSGREFLENWNKFKKEMTSTNKPKFEHFLSSNEFINLPLFTTLEGKDNVEYNSVFKVIYLEHNLLKKNHMALELESGIFTKEQIPKVREILEKYGESLYPKGPLGYGGYGLLLSFFYNTPNNTLPVIWQKSPSEFCDWTRKWVPIFPRKERRKFTEI